MTKVSFLAFLVSMICMGLVEQGFSQSLFYEGKTITIIQATNPGGTGDLRRKALAPYLQKHIPGNPTIVFQYMPGGGGRKAANHIYRSVRPDGLTIGGFSTGLVSSAVLATEGIQYDIDKLIYLGTPTSAAEFVFLTRRDADLNSLEKLRAAQGVRVGGQQVGHEVYNVGRLFAYLIGLREPRFPSGYTGPELDLALMQGELDARANTVATVIRRGSEWIEKGLADFHAIMEVPTGNRTPVFGHLPSIDFFAKSDKDRKLLTAYRAFQLVGTPYVLPPGTPQPQVRILQEAMRKAMSDPAFHREFTKLVGYEPSPYPAEELQKTIRDIPREAEIVDLLNAISGAGPLPPR